MSDYQSPNDELDHFIAQYKSLYNLEGASKWVADAKIFITRLEQYISGIEANINSGSQSLIQTQQNTSFMGRLFGSEIKKIKSEIEQNKRQKDIFVSYLERLRALQGSLPNSKPEQAAMLRDYKLRLKDLRSKKREANALIKEVRLEARQQAANLDVSLGGLLGGSKYRGAKKREIRSDKENAIAPYEARRNKIEREIIELEQLIAFIERFE